jgi:thiol-disulfide isomerase/thioredoxin
MRLNRLGLAAFALAAASCLSARAAAPAVGQPAPALTFTDLLQAPAGAKTDWPSLRGKVVVLEFWATWCSGCVEEIPHLNSLIQSLDPNKVQFIAVDDEDPALVKKFLTKLPIGGWLGFDTSKKIIDAYGVFFRPQTFVIDSQGRVAAILHPNLLTKEQLLALAGGKPATFPANDETAERREQAFKEAKAATDGVTAATDGPKPLFDLSIRPGDPAGKTVFVHRRPGKTDNAYTEDMLNAPLSMLFSYVAGMPQSRLVIHGTAPYEKYSLHLAAPEGDIHDLAPAIELAIATAASMKLSRVATEEDAYVLQATPKTASLLPPATSDRGSYCFYNPNAAKLVMLKSTLGSLAQTLETVLDKPVVNETGIAGSFDANFDLPRGDAEAARAALEKNLGLTLVKAKRNIERIVLDAPPAPQKAADNPAPAAASPAKP